MEKVKLTLNLLIKVIEDMKDKILNNYISHVAVVNSTDMLFQFSFYTKEKMFISLNHSNPLLTLVNRSFSSATTLGALNENLRKYISGSYLIDIELLNNDRIVKISLNKSNEFYEKEKLYLIIELIPTRANLIILDKDNKIIYAFHYIDLISKRPILKGLEYIELISNTHVVEDNASLEDYKKYISSYLLEAESKRKKEAHKDLYNCLISKKKSLEKKIIVLNKEIENAKDSLIYQEYGQMIYAYMDDEEALNTYIKENLEGIYDENKSPTYNANKIFNKYKKFKRTIEMGEVEIAKTKDAIKEIEIAINTFDYLDEDEFFDLYNKYLYKGKGKNKKNKVDARMPFYVTYKGVNIGYGKNHEQNEYLTFKKANRNDTFLHIEDYSGSHIVIFSEKIDNDLLLTASEICLILAKRKDGDIKYTEVFNVKKGSTPGNVNLLKYKLITLRNIRPETYELLNSQKRFKA